MFKVGDIVEGISENYVITRTGWVGTVKEIVSTKHIKVISSKDEAFVVNQRYFKLHEPKLITITDSYV